MAENKDVKFLTYKNRPLVRCGKTLYYGNMSDPYVVMLQICNTRNIGDSEVSGRVTVQMLNTDPTVRPREHIAKKCERQGLYQAMDIASIWLDRM